MILKCLFARRKNNDDGLPELLTAWDEWSVEENPDGFATSCQAHLTALADELASFRYVDVMISETVLEDAFEVATISGAIVAAVLE